MKVNGRLIASSSQLTCYLSFRNVVFLRLVKSLVSLILVMGWELTSWKTQGDNSASIFRL